MLWWLGVAQLKFSAHTWIFISTFSLCKCFKRPKVGIITPEYKGKNASMPLLGNSAEVNKHGNQKLSSDESLTHLH
eukprot:29653-Pelagococcus_subviridis.AAC.7